MDSARRPAHRPPHRLGAAVAALAVAAGLAAVPASGAAAAGGTVSVLYAASLTQLMEQQVGPAFLKATGYTLAGLPAGSKQLAQEIASGQQRADVFISASPQPDAVLLAHPAHGAITWYATFASSPLVIGYNPRSRFAKALLKGPWYAVMREKGFRLGRTDPVLDPKGALTEKFMTAAASYYHQPHLVSQVLGPTENPSQVFAEETLVGRLQAGQLDAGFFYRNEAVTAHIPFITPPAALTMGALFTIALPAGGQDPAGAVAFVKFLLGPRGQALMRQAGLLFSAPTVFAEQVPKALWPVLYPWLG